MRSSSLATPQHLPINCFNIIVFAIAYSCININFIKMVRVNLIGVAIALQKKLPKIYYN
ncbi:hypothetical protein [Planktothrix sp. PCC 11201]|uniref:hypothetical protein n=1 Tax=Planktothrix sp. PCC 11201 TaxID=1729650 RepID=UPI00135672CF|nr:hypothetical protein [Planktothrix sp. PCC 11201]